jgi:hypothetical protein
MNLFVAFLAPLRETFLLETGGKIVKERNK